MVYSPSVHHFPRADRPASGPFHEPLRPAGSFCAVRRAPSYGAKDTQGIGMTRGFVSLHLTQRSSCGPAFAVALLLLLASFTIAVPAHAQSAASWNRRGQAA